MNNQEKLEFLKKFYNNMSDGEFKERLEKAGFEIVEDIAGKIIVEDDDIDHIEHPDFTITTTVYQYLVKEKFSVSFSMDSNLGATA